MATKPAVAARKVNGSFESALAALRHGHRLRRAAWHPSLYIVRLERDHKGRLIAPNLFLRDIVGNHVPCRLPHDDLFAGDWRLVETPEPEDPPSPVTEPEHVAPPST